MCFHTGLVLRGHLVAIMDVGIERLDLLYVNGRAERAGALSLCMTARIAELAREFGKQARLLQTPPRVGATDTDQIRAWKAELSRLDQGVIPTGDKETASSLILREVMLKSLDLQLEKTAAAERARRLDEARQESRRRLDKVPGPQEDIASLQRGVAARDLEKRAIEESLGRLRTSLDPGATGFSLVSEAQRSSYPESSNRRALLVMTVFAGLALGLGLALVGELKDQTVRSAAEAPHRLKAPLLGVAPLLPAGGGAPPRG